jgi:RHS repeat-associated protein
MAERFRLGFANRTLGLCLPAKNRAPGAAVRKRLEELGIYRESGHEHFNGSLVIPVFNPDGEVVEMYGRKITAKLREGTPLHLYLKGEHRGVWNEEALIASKEIILCEALIDALTFWCAGLRAGCAGNRVRSRCSGEQYDPDLALYYLRARYYNPATGRFLSRDTEDGKPVDPKTLHKYLYASGDPVNRVDPRGRGDLIEYGEEDWGALAEEKGFEASARRVNYLLCIDGIVAFMTGNGLDWASAYPEIEAWCAKLNLL